jgi:TRAP-type uncharacterized transport system fused permease subunit
VFLLSVWGELSPPTSLTAAVSARIANVSFMRTMYEALKICAPITLMTFAIFTRSNMVTTTGWLQVADTLLVLASTLGVTFAMFGRTHPSVAVDLMLRCPVAGLSFVVMFHPSMHVAASIAVLVMLAVIAGIYRHNKMAPATYATGGAEDVTGPQDNLAPVLAEAKRDIG